MWCVYNAAAGHATAILEHFSAAFSSTWKETLPLLNASEMIRSNFAGLSSGVKIFRAAESHKTPKNPRLVFASNSH